MQGPKGGAAMRFQDRTDAGNYLATRLLSYLNCPNGIVLALPRGGVPVAFEVAQVLHLPLDILVVRKLGVPEQPELAMGAIAPNGVRFLNQRVVQSLKIPESVLEHVTLEEQQELDRRMQLYRGDRPPLKLQAQTVILVDDGLATGSTMRVAVRFVQQSHPQKVVVAVPVASQATCNEFATLVDEVVCATTPEPFHAVGQGYVNFAQTTDEEVRSLLARSATPYFPMPSAASSVNS